MLRPLDQPPHPVAPFFPRAGTVGLTAACFVLLLVFAALSPARAQPPDPAAPPTIDLDATGVEIGGLAGGERIVVLGLARVPVSSSAGSLVQRRRWATLAAAGPDGTVRLVPELGDDTDPVPPRSVWVAVSLATGAAATAAAPGSELLAMDLEDGDLVLPPAPGGALRTLARRMEGAEVLLVRPRSGAAGGGGVGDGNAGTAGAWTLSVWDGSPSDGDGADDGRFTVDINRFEPVADPDAGEAPPGPELRAVRGRDVLAVIDPYTLAVGMLEQPVGPEGDAAPGSGTE